MTRTQMQRYLEIVKGATDSYKASRLTKEQVEAVASKFLRPVQYTIGADRDWRVARSLQGILSSASPSADESEIEAAAQSVYGAVHEIRVG